MRGALLLVPIYLGKHSSKLVDLRGPLGVAPSHGLLPYLFDHKNPLALMSAFLAILD